jgi:L-threonylcarbamoyladenylate synthase
VATSATEIPLVPADEQGIAAAAEAVRRGGVVAFPTETLYGLGVDALDPDAIQRLVALKGRREGHPIPVLVADREMLGCVVGAISGTAQELMDRHWPGPLTLVMPGLPGLPPALLNSRGGVGVRVSSDPVAGALLRQVGRPLTATSANLAGDSPAATPHSARIPGVRLVLDGGERGGDASTVVEVGEGGRLVVLRRGAVEMGRW